MVIILIDLPSYTDYEQIENFIRPAIKGGYLGSISIKIQKHPTTLEIKHHGLVRITPDDIAAKAIVELNGTEINGKPVDVHEYRTRYWHNDPRILSTRSDSNNMRKGERRQFL